MGPSYGQGPAQGQPGPTYGHGAPGPATPPPSAYPASGQPGYPPQAPFQGHPGQPGAYPAYGAAPSAPQTESKAIVGLIMAIASWVVCPIVLAIIALVLASQSNKEIAGSGGRLGGHGINTATKWISWINIIAFVVGTLIFIGIMIFAVSQDPTIFESPFPRDTQF